MSTYLALLTLRIKATPRSHQLPAHFYCALLPLSTRTQLPADTSRQKHAHKVQSFVFLGLFFCMCLSIFSRRVCVICIEPQTPAAPAQAPSYALSFNQKRPARQSCMAIFSAKMMLVGAFFVFYGALTKKARAAVAWPFSARK